MAGIELNTQHGVLPVYGQTSIQSIVVTWPDGEPFPREFTVEAMDGSGTYRYVLDEARPQE